MTLSYADANLGGSPLPDPALVRDLQTHLRALGYLRRMTDGQFGPGTRSAVRRLELDLLNNHGGGRDGIAPVAMIMLNRGVTAITGVVDRALADSIETALGDARVLLLPESHNPTADNRAALHAVISLPSPVAPTPFLLAIFQQESSGQHFAVPRPGDGDGFIKVGLDTNGATQDEVTSRRYGIGQYTLFHHPPHTEDVDDVMIDPVRNVQRAYRNCATSSITMWRGRTPRRTIARWSIRSWRCACAAKARATHATCGPARVARARWASLTSHRTVRSTTVRRRPTVRPSIIATVLCRGARPGAVPVRLAVGGAPP